MDYGDSELQLTSENNASPDVGLLDSTWPTD